MKITSAQLFVRHTSVTDDGRYMVCGLIRSDEPLKDGSVYTISNLKGDLLLVEDRKEETAGKALDQVMRTPIWRLK